ncbi:hypothetical protein KC19_VG318900 [Ceratodon purpureus]|uniref:Uncharacterized protein n=1 Tax=Ceratodon purpureus TaxID=3225 RepID=A0A8T0HWQ3_CERPU|nr:hypothetical protein KC19_VG318900 [Ceratodon purpureus]
MAAEVPAEVAAVEEEVQRIFEALKVLKDFDQGAKEGETKSSPEVVKLVVEKKKAFDVRELNTYIALRKTFTSSIAKKNEALDGGSLAGTAIDGGSQVASGTFELISMK